LQYYTYENETSHKGAIDKITQAVISKAAYGPDISKAINAANAVNATVIEAINLAIHINPDSEVVQRYVGQRFAVSAVAAQVIMRQLSYLSVVLKIAQRDVAAGQLHLAPRAQPAVPRSRLHGKHCVGYAIGSNESQALVVTNLIGRCPLESSCNDGHVAVTSLDGVEKHTDTILNALRDRDISVRRRGLDLLYSMCDESNSRRIVAEYAGGHRYRSCAILHRSHRAFTNLFAWTALGCSTT